MRRMREMEIERVYYKHYRYFDTEHNGNFVTDDVEIIRPYTRGQTAWQPTCKGGRTECHLIVNEQLEIIGVANCSLKDNFNYRLGRAIAFGRAMKKYNIILRHQHTMNIATQ